MTKCPYCQEEIKEGALVCKHCGRDFSILLHVVEQVERTRVEVIEEVKSVWKRLDTVEAQLLAAHESRVAAWKPVVLIAGTGLAVALAHWLSWETFDPTVEDIMSIVALALAPLVAILVGLARPGRTWKTYPLLGGVAGLGIIGAEWIQIGVTLLESLMILTVVVVAASAAGWTGRWLRQLIDFLRAPGALERAESGVTRLTRLTKALKPLATAAAAVIPVTVGILEARGEQDSFQRYVAKTDAELTPSFIADQLIQDDILYVLEMVELGETNLENFVNSFGDAHFFREDMDRLKSIGLITFSGGNYAGAGLTDRGRRVLAFIDTTESSVQQIPPLDRLPPVMLGADTHVSDTLVFPVHWRLEITDVNQYIVTATSDDGGDPVVELRDENYFSLGSDDDSGTDYNARLGCVLERGTYRVLVDRFGFTGSFTLRVDRDSVDFVGGQTSCSPSPFGQ